MDDRMDGKMDGQMRLQTINLGGPIFSDAQSSRFHLAAGKKVGSANAIRSF